MSVVDDSRDGWRGGGGGPPRHLIAADIERSVRERDECIRNAVAPSGVEIGLVPQEKSTIPDGNPRRIERRGRLKKITPDPELPRCVNGQCVHNIRAQRTIEPIADEMPLRPVSLGQTSRARDPDRRKISACIEDIISPQGQRLNRS